MLPAGMLGDGEKELAAMSFGGHLGLLQAKILYWKGLLLVLRAG